MSSIFSGTAGNIAIDGIVRAHLVQNVFCEIVTESSKFGKHAFMWRNSLVETWSLRFCKDVSPEKMSTLGITLYYLIDDIHKKSKSSKTFLQLSSIPLYCFTVKSIRKSYKKWDLENLKLSFIWKDVLNNNAWRRSVTLMSQSEWNC